MVAFFKNICCIIMECLKSKLRTKLSDGHLQDVMLLASSNLKPNIDKLADQKQHQASHRQFDNE